MVLRKEFTPKEDGTDHGAVSRAFLQHTAQARRQIGTSLDRLRERRRRADCDMNLGADQNFAEKAVDDAKKVLLYLASQ